MGYITSFWRRLTKTNALEHCDGKLEAAFFDSVYRVTYIAGHSTTDRNTSYLIYSYGIKSVIALFVCSELWYLFSAKNLDGIIDNINVTIINIITIYRYKNMIDNIETFKKLASAMESPYFDVSCDRRRKLVDFWLDRNERYLKLLLFLGTSTLAAWYVYPLVDDIEYNLAVAVRIPFDYRRPVLYPITYTVVIIAFNYTAFFVMVNDLIMQAHLMHLLCQYAVLTDCFENILFDCGYEDGKRDIILNEDFRKKFLKQLGNMVNQHKFLLDQSMKLRKILSLPMLGQFAASAMLICFIGYQATATLSVSLTKFLMSLFYLGYNLFELYIFCRWCEEIKVQSESICEAIYFSGWECGVVTLLGVKSRILLILMRASKPVVLTAGGLYDLSLSSYSTLLKTSYSFLTVLLRLPRN